MTKNGTADVEIADILGVTEANVLMLLELCPEMHALAKMAEMAINRQTINKNSNEMAKGPFAKWRF